MDSIREALKRGRRGLKVSARSISAKSAGMEGERPPRYTVEEREAESVTYVNTLLLLK